MKVVLGIHIQKLCEKLHRVFRADVQGFHEGNRKRGKKLKELDQQMSWNFGAQETREQTYFDIKGAPNPQFPPHKYSSTSNQICIRGELRRSRKWTIAGEGIGCYMLCSRFQ